VEAREFLPFPPSRCLALRRFHIVSWKPTPAAAALAPAAKLKEAEMKMKTRTVFGIDARAIVSVMLLATLAGRAAAQGTERVSIGLAGLEGNGNSASGSCSADGRFVAFWSYAFNWVPQTYGGAQVFVRDRLLGTIEIVSVSSAGATGNNYSGREGLAISADGRYVAFLSEASNLVPGDTNAQPDAFVRDRQSGTTERVSVSSAGAQATIGTYSGISISGDGRYVVFSSPTTNLVPGDTNGAQDVFLRDRLNNTTEIVSLSSAGAAGSATSEYPVISPDGRFVAFRSDAVNLVAADTNGYGDVFVRDRQSGTTERVSVSSAGAQGSLGSQEAAISADGRWVAFESAAPNFVTGDTNAKLDVFLRDRQTGTTTRVSVDSSGAQGNGDSMFPSMSADGRYLSFLSDAPNLVSGDTNAVRDLFLRDREVGTTERVSVGSAGAQQNGDSPLGGGAPLSADGRYLVFCSFASNLVAGDTNGFADTFVRDRGQPSILAFCFGDGTGTNCPCGNNSAVGAGSGCLSSLGVGGRLTASGNPSITNDTLVLGGSGMPNSSALYFQGTAQQSGGAGSTFGDGLRCAGGSITRLGTKVNASGASQYPTGGDSSISVRGGNAAGNLRTYQCWYRNSAAFCTTSNFNLTNGVQITWTP
jgi:Tol biopolymer transport system component